MKKSKSSKKYKREKRYFSEEFRRARVKEYEEGKATVLDICRAYHVSETAVYHWIKKYSIHYQKSIIKVVQEKSETKKRLALEKKVGDLEKVIGQQHVQIQYYHRLLQMIGDHYDIDFEKNSDWKSLHGFLKIDRNIP